MDAQNSDTAHVELATVLVDLALRGPPQHGRNQELNSKKKKKYLSVSDITKQAPTRFLEFSFEFIFKLGKPAFMRAGSGKRLCQSPNALAKL